MASTGSMLPDALTVWVAPNVLGEGEFFFVEVDGDDRIGADDGGRANGRQADAADTEHGDRFARAHLGCVQHGAGACEHCAADDAGQVARMIMRDGHHQILAGLHVARPGVDVAVGFLAFEQSRPYSRAASGREPASAAPTSRGTYRRP